MVVEVIVGMETAIMSKARGYKVMIYEENERLGMLYYCGVGTRQAGDL